MRHRGGLYLQSERVRAVVLRFYFQEHLNQEAVKTPEPFS